MKTREGHEPLQLDLDYRNRVVHELREKRGPVRSTIISKDDPDREAKILAMQPASTRRTLERPKSQDAAWLARPIPLEAQIAESAKDMAQYERKITPDELLREEARRRRPKNSTGQSEAPGPSREAMESAANAFVYSPPATLNPHELAKIKDLKPIPRPPEPEPEQKPKSKWGWLPGRFLTFGRRE